MLKYDDPEVMALMGVLTALPRRVSMVACLDYIEQFKMLPEERELFLKLAEHIKDPRALMDPELDLDCHFNDCDTEAECERKRRYQHSVRQIIKGTASLWDSPLLQGCG